jgi:hypothetical protein
MIPDSPEASRLTAPGPPVFSILQVKLSEALSVVRIALGADVAVAIAHSHTTATPGPAGDVCVTALSPEAQNDLAVRKMALLARHWAMATAKSPAPAPAAAVSVAAVAGAGAGSSEVPTTGTRAML